MYGKLLLAVAATSYCAALAMPQAVQPSSNGNEPVANPSAKPPPSDQMPTQSPKKGEPQTQAAATGGLTKRHAHNAHHEQLQVEIAFFLDNFLWRDAVERFGERDAPERLATYAGAIFSHTQHLYTHPSMKPKIDLKLVHYEVWKNGQPEDLCEKCIGYQPEPKDRVDGPKYFGLWNKSKRQTSGKWDAAFLLSGTRDFAGAAGWAMVGGACDPLKRGGLISVVSNPSNTPHELGHMLNMNHDADEKWSTPSPDRVKRGFVWSARRIKGLHDKLAQLNADKNGGNCLKVDNVPVTTSPIQIPAMPADRYDADKQCQWHGVQLKALHNENHPQDQWCSGMFCKERGVPETKIVQQAIYGTGCGQNKICAMQMDWAEHENRCLDRNRQFSTLDHFNFAYGDCKGHDIEKAGITNSNLEQCAQQCHATKECKAFLFFKGGCAIKSHHCDLKLEHAGDQEYQFYLKHM